MSLLKPFSAKFQSIVGSFSQLHVHVLVSVHVPCLKKYIFLYDLKKWVRKLIIFILFHYFIIIAIIIFVSKKNINKNILN